MIQKLLSYFSFLNSIDSTINKSIVKNEVANHGEKLLVDLNCREILESNYFEEIENYQSSNVNTLNYLSGEEFRNVSKVNIIKSVIVYYWTNPKSNKVEKFVGEIISKDRITLAMFASKVRWAEIYFDPENTSNYYFNLQELLFHLA